MTDRLGFQHERGFFIEKLPFRIKMRTLSKEYYFSLEILLCSLKDQRPALSVENFSIKEDGLPAERSSRFFVEKIDVSLGKPDFGRKRWLLVVFI